MGVVTGEMVLSLTSRQAVSSGLALPDNLEQAWKSPAIPGMNVSFTNGTGAGQVDQLYRKALTVNATTQSIDLTSLPLVDGTTGSAGRTRLLYLYNPDTTVTKQVKLYAHATNGVSWLPLSANGLIARGGKYGQILLVDRDSTGAGNGFYVDSTHKVIVVDTGANNVTFDLLMMCSSVQ